MKINGSLENVQAEVKTSDHSSARTGGFWWRSDTGKMMVADGTVVRALLRNDDKCIIGNSGTAATNVRIYRSGTGKVQITLGNDATAEGSVSTAVAEIASRAENYINASKPANASANAGRIIYNSTDDRLEWDNGTTWVAASSSASSGSVDAVDVIIDKAYQNKDRGLNELLPNSVTNNFVQPDAAFQCYLMEDYTAAGSSLKMVTNPLFVNNSDKLTDSATGWAEGNTDTTLNAVSATKKIGTNSLSFDKDSTAATTAAFISRSTPGDSVYENTNLYYWIQVPSGITGTLANTFVRLGSSSTNYRQWTKTADYAGTTIASATWHLIKIDVSDTTGSTTGGSGWTTATALSYFAVGITTDASGDLQAGVLIDGIAFADSTGKYVALGDQLTIYNASTRDSFVVDSASTTYNGLITLGASLSNSYTANSATFIKRTTLTATGDSQIAFCTDGLSGTIKATQEVRVKRVLPASLVNQNFKAFATFLTGENFYVTTVNTNTSIVLESGVDVSANWKSGRVVDVAEKVGDSNGGYTYIPRTDNTYTMTGNSTFSGSSLTLPMTTTGTIAVGDLVVKRQVNCYSSIVSKTANEAFTAMTRDRIEVLDPGIPYFYSSSVWAHFPLSGPAAEINIAPGGGTSAGQDLTVNGSLNKFEAFTKSRFGSSGFSDTNYYSISAGNSETISGDSADCTNFALSMWFYPIAFTGSTRTLVNKGSTAGNDGWGLILGSAANTISQIVDGSQNTIGTFNANAWNHVYYFFVDGAQSFYLNGIAGTSATRALTDSARLFRIGRETDSSLSAAGCKMADLVIWRNTTVLTASQVKSIYGNGTPNIFGPNGSGFKYRFSQLAQTGQKLSIKAELTREDDTDDPALWAIGLVKT